MNFTRVSWVVLVVAMAGCATPYSQSPFDGFSDTRLGENTFSVSFSGNDMSRQETIEDYARLRAADLTRAYGFRFFQIKSQSRYKNTLSVNLFIPTPGVSYIIECSNEKFPEGVSYEATYVASSIRAQYKIDDPWSHPDPSDPAFTHKVKDVQAAK